MSLLFISHSSVNNADALALHDWLVSQGWDELFLDLDPQQGILAGERWERALHQAANRCDAVLFLISEAWLASEWCRREFRLAQKLNKQIFGLLIEELDIESLPVELTDSWQLVDLARGTDHEAPREVVLPDGKQAYITFSASGLTRLKAGLSKAGLDPRFFPWPPANDPLRPPYRGLLPLEAEDAGIFFGREASIIELLALVRGLREAAPPRFQTILGASGAGKSSFLRAGVLPRLDRDDRHFLPLPIIRPEQAVLSGPNGLEQALVSVCGNYKLRRTRKQLRDAIAGGCDALLSVLSDLSEGARLPMGVGEGESIPPTLVLAIDQAEELFLSDGQEESRIFLSLLTELLYAEQVGLMVLCTIRSDSYEQLQNAPLLEGIRQQAFSLPPLPRGAYQQVIEGPAKLLSDTAHPLVIEPRLTQAILEDLEKGGSKDTLPLLAFTLERLYRYHGGDGDLRLDDYRQEGGIEGVIDAAVTNALADARKDPKVPDDEEECLTLLRRGLIPWLATIDTKSRSPRRKVAQLKQIPPEAITLIRYFIEHRLLAADTDEHRETTVEPAHEALLRQWGRLRGWLEDSAAEFSVLDNLQSASRDWEGNSRKEPWLTHSKARLEEAESVVARSSLRGAATTVDHDYLAACRARDSDHQQQELDAARKLSAAKTKAAEKSQQATRNMRIGLYVAIILAVLMGLSTLWAIHEQQVSNSRALAFEAINELDTNPQNALTLAKKSYKEADTLLARESLLKSLHSNRSIWAIRLSVDGHDPQSIGAGNGTVVVVLGAKIVTLTNWSEKAEPTVSTMPLEGEVSDDIRASVSPDGAYLISKDSNTGVHIWAVQGNSELDFSLRGGLISKETFHPTEPLVALAEPFSERLVLVSLETGEIVNEWPLDASVVSLAFSNHGRYLFAMMAFSKTIYRYDIETGKTIEIPVSAVPLNIEKFHFFEEENILAFSCDGSACGRVYRIRNGGQSLKRLFLELGHSHLGPKLDIYSDESQSIAVASYRPYVDIWDLKKRRKEGSLIGHKNTVFHVDHEKGGKLIATASLDGTARIWAKDSLEEIARLSGHSGPVDRVKFVDKGLVFTIDRENILRLWKVYPLLHRTLSLHELDIMSIPGDMKSQRVMHGDVEGKARSTNIASSTATSIYEESSILMSWNDESHQVVSQGKTGEIFATDTMRGITIHIGNLQNEEISTSAYCTEKDLGVFGTKNGRLGVWHGGGGNSFQLLKKDDLIQVSNGPIKDLDFNTSCDSLLVVGAPSEASIWNIEDKLLVRSFEIADKHQIPTRGLFSSDDTLIAVGGRDGLVTVWNAQNGKPVWAGDYGGKVYDLQFISHDKKVAIGLPSKGVIVNMENGEILNNLSGLIGETFDVTVNYAGTKLATASNDGNAKIWNVSTGELECTLMGHTKGIYSIEFSDADDYVATASADGLVKVWHVPTCRIVQEFVAGIGQVLRASFSADGKRILTIGGDGTVREWKTYVGFTREELLQVDDSGFGT
jgi:WD40 repeat protein